MPKLIDLEKIKPIDFPSTEMDGLDVVRYLNTLPTVDSMELVRGRWIWISDSIVSCSQCNRNFYSEDDVNAGVNWYYCPKCGAKMDGVSDG